MTNKQCIKLSLLLLAISFLITTGCGQPSSKAPPIATDFLDTSISELHNLGWLGAKCHPLNKPLRFADPENSDETVSPGGIVIAETADALPLAKANLEKGDVIVRIADDWLPIKEDPTIDLIRAVEDQINAQKRKVELGYFRDGKFNTTFLETDIKSLDEGVPLATERLVNSSTAMLRHLESLQSEDGSFPINSDSRDGKLIATSMAGLAFLSADKSVRSEFISNTEQVVAFLNGNLPSTDSEDSTSLNPLTAAYVACFLAESNVQLMDEDWLEKIGALAAVFSATQHESGGWNVTPESPESDSESESELVDVNGTNTTNQVLLAVAAMERKGMTGENDLIEKGCGYLHRQAQLRVPDPLDRRIKAALSAGSVAALVALNTDRSDLQLQQYLKNAQERAHDMYTSPALALPGLLQTAIASRQLGNESWLQFHNSVKHLLVALQNSDGSVAEYPYVKRNPLEFELSVAGEAWQTAHLAILQSMQSQSLRKLLALDQPPMMVARDSTGKKSADKPGGGMISLDGGKVSDAEELKKMIMEKLKEQGMDIDESKMKIMSAPAGKSKDDK